MIDLPSSKSITHRALICAALASGKSILLNPLVCDDTLTTCDVLEKLRIRIEKSAPTWVVHGGSFTPPKKKLYVTPQIVADSLPHPTSPYKGEEFPLLYKEGLGEVDRRAQLLKTLCIDCNESGTTWRFITALTSFLKIPCEIIGKKSLLQRPIKPLLEALQCVDEIISLDGNISSQFLSGILLAAPLSDKPVTIKLTTPLVSKPYVEMTLDVQKKFGIFVEAKRNFREFFVSPQKYRPAEIEIEKDWSAAAFFIAAGLLSKPLTLTKLNPKSLQADRVIETIAKEMGGKLEWAGNNLNVFPSKLRAIEWNLKNSPDLFPIVSVLNACAQRKGKLTGIENLKFKESNRLKAMQKLLQNPNVIDSTDHRIIMAGAVLGLTHKQKPKILHPESVSKSFPNFWDQFRKVTL